MTTQVPRNGKVEGPTDEQVASAVGTLKLLADPTRLRIVWALLHGEHSVNELADHVGANPAAVSQHLAKLRLTRVVKSRRDGTRIFYAAHDTHIRQLVEEALFHADHLTGGLADHERTRSDPGPRKRPVTASADGRRKSEGRR
jgi:DNA-binding transcriptional ArsR family regulator